MQRMSELRVSIVVRFQIQPPIFNNVQKDLFQMPSVRVGHRSAKS